MQPGDLHQLVLECRKVCAGEVVGSALVDVAGLQLVTLIDDVVSSH